MASPARRTSPASRRRHCRLLLLAMLSSAATTTSTTAAATTTAAVVQQKLYGLTSGLAYYIQMNIGQPLYSVATASSATNNFRLLVDTGSANTAVVTADCCSLTNTALYSCAASSTCAAQGTSVSVSYITGSWSGVLVQDTFSGAGLDAALESVAFTAIEKEANFIQTGYDGIVGLGYAAIAAPTAKPPTPYFDHMRAVKSVPDVFSMLMCGSLQVLSQSSASSTTNVSLAALAADSAELYAGELLLGGTAGVNGESYHSGELVYTPLVQAKWYNVIVTDISVGGASLGLSCKSINTPRSIVDSGTSNIAFPSEVFSAVVTQLKADVRKVLPSAPDSFFSDDVPCCSALCDPTSSTSKIAALPALTLSLAVDGSSEQLTFAIPAEYIWRPILVRTTSGNVKACRVFGISEGDITLLGDVFMDGLFTVHDRINDRLGFGVAKLCPNGVTSTKTVTVQTLSGTDSLCDCVSDSDRKSSLLASYLPFGSGKPCFFWQWWMYIVIASLAVIVLAVGVVAYLAWRRRKLLKELQHIRSTRTGQQQPSRLPSRQLSDGLERNLLTPSAREESSEASATSIPITVHETHLSSSSKSTSRSAVADSSTAGGTLLQDGYRPPSTASTVSVYSNHASPVAPSSSSSTAPHHAGDSAV